MFGPDHLKGVGDGVTGKEHGAEQRRLGFDVVRRHPRFEALPTPRASSETRVGRVGPVGAGYVHRWVPKPWLLIVLDLA